MANAIMPYLTKAISSDTIKNSKRAAYKFHRALKGSKPTLDIFLRLDDPYCYLLIQITEPFLNRFNVEARFHTVLELQPEMFPAMDMWYQNASRDASHLAELYDLNFPADNTKITDRNVLKVATSLLLAAESESNFIAIAKDIFKQVWHGAFVSDENKDTLDNSQLTKQLNVNQKLLEEKGHYFGGMINFEGEWYWGLDRLDHLEDRLIKQGHANSSDDFVRFNLTYKNFCQKNIKDLNIKKTPFTIYWSARSPYSYIGLERAVQLSEFYKIPLIIKPVLPMMMRGMNVPQVKKMYIFLDTKREAEKLGLPYGYVADPLGPAVERCYSLLDYARSENKLQNFLLSFARAVNTQGIRAETDAGMKIIIERCGLRWDTAKSKINSSHWKEEVKDNLDEMYEQGCWGVPSFRYGDNVFWGQDRLGIIEKLIQKNIISS